MSWGGCAILIAFVLSFCTSQETFDTYQPLVRISPAVNQNSRDRFGFSLTFHRLEDAEESDSVENALGKITVIVGAPNGQFPGGISGIEYSYQACAEQLDTSDTVTLMNTTQAERAACLADFVTGLVYKCDLSASRCGPMLGNNDSTSADGYLFDRAGNDLNFDGKDGADFKELKQDQFMGFSMTSGEGYFVACAPLWKYNTSTGTPTGPQPRGQCVFSDRTLENFSILRPCITGGGLNQNEGGYCSAGMKDIAIKRNETAEIVIGTPNRYFGRGGVAYYQVPETLAVGAVTHPTVPPGTGMQDTVGRRHVNTYLDFDTRYGFSFASGRILNLTTNETQFVVGAPRFSEDSNVGYVFVVPKDQDYKALPNATFVEGEQFAEFFGYSLECLDLNNDGFDDLVVSAPFYYENNVPELGRIFVFENDQNNGFENATIIVGFKAYSRFGTSVTSVGDINNDGYADFAVSAPLEDSGVIYIYHGQARDGDGSIVNTQYAQRIDGGSFVDRVSNISEVSMFGFSLSRSMDIDNNQFNDLAIGAYGSQSVFVLRARPFATVVSNLSSVEEVKLDSYSCDLNGAIYSCFPVTLCAEFTGKSIATEFTTNFIVRETSRPRRLLFTSDVTASSITTPITFYGENNETCVTVNAYIRNGTTSLEDFTLSGEVLNIDRPEVVVDTNTDPIDLSTLPVIQAEPLAVMVEVFAECGPDDVCVSDLGISDRVQIEYRETSGQLSENQSALVVGDVSQVTVTTTFSNIAEDAFNSFIVFSVPKQFFTFDQASISMVRVLCEETDASNDTHETRRCNILSPFSITNGNVSISMRLSVKSIIGNEGSISIPMSISVGLNSTRNNESLDTLSNNDIDISIPVTATAVFTVAVLFDTNSIRYQGNHTPNVNGEASNLGEELLLTATFRNQGPSPIRNAMLSVYVPSRSTATGQYYFYYPARLSTTSNKIQCSATEGINPEGYTVGRGRRRRSRAGGRDEGLTRTLRQSTADSINVDCSTTPADCVAINCNITDLGQSSVDVVVTGYIDERFFYRKMSSYRLRAFAEGNIVDDFYNTNGSQLNSKFNVSLSIQSQRSSSSNLPPWYVIAAPIAGAFIFLLILAVALYFFGFFSRKSKRSGEGAGEDEFDQFDANPFASSKAGGGGSAPAGGASLGDPELMKYEQKGKEA